MTATLDDVEIKTWEDGIRAGINMLLDYDSREVEWTTDDLELVMSAILDATGRAVHADELHQLQWDQLWQVFGAIGWQFWAAGFASPLPLKDHAVKLLSQKQNDYGVGNIDAFGRAGLVVRAHDKVARILNLQKRGGAAKNEALADSFFDIVGYSAIAVGYDRGWFHLPLSADQAPHG